MYDIDISQRTEYNIIIKRECLIQLKKELKNMYYGYIRVSTETQAEKGYGLDAQRTEIEKYAAAQGIELKAIFEDAGISGNLKDDDEDDAINKRGGLMELLTALNEGDTVVILNTSRLWRSDMTKAIIRRELIKRKAAVISVEQPKYNLYNKDPNEYLINSIMEALDVYERMSISLKLARGRTVKARGGNKPAGVAPFGYRYADDRKSVIVDDTEAAVVKEMFSAAQKGATLAQISEALNSKGYKTRRGGEWTRGSIRAILINRFYIGELQHQGKPITGNHKALISKVQFGKVSSQLAQRHK